MTQIKRDILYVGADDAEQRSILLELYKGGVRPDRGLASLRRAIVRMASGGDTSPSMRFLIRSMLFSGTVRLVLPRRKRGLIPMRGVREVFLSAFSDGYYRFDASYPIMRITGKM